MYYPLRYHASTLQCKSNGLSFSKSVKTHDGKFATWKVKYKYQPENSGKTVLVRISKL